MRVHGVPESHGGITVCQLVSSGQQGRTRQWWCDEPKLFPTTTASGALGGLPWLWLLLLLSNAAPYCRSVQHEVLEEGVHGGRFRSGYHELLGRELVEDAVGEDGCLP